jgi:ribosomal protein S18 acetylase RimI-like enzyme
LSVRIRSASRDDAEAIARVHVQAWQETYRGMVPDGLIAALYLRDAVKRRGIGRALLQELFSALAGSGFVPVGLWVAIENAAARGFYEALGGRAAHTREDKRGEHELRQIAYVWDDVGRFGH